MERGPRCIRLLAGVAAVGAIMIAAVLLVRCNAVAQDDAKSSPLKTDAAEPPSGAESAASEVEIPTEPTTPTPEEAAALAEGKALFRGLCSGCHGGAGRGGKGPNLTDTRWIHGSTDADIRRVIENGVPRTTMKKLGESLKEEQIAHIIAYIRSLASGAQSDWQPYITGDPEAGRQLFFDEKGKAQCAKCHSIGGKGGRIGPALDRIASRRSGQYIVESILLPSKDIDPQYESVQAVTAEGRIIKGLRVNETNFSLQLREENGRFHSLLKRDLEAFQVLKISLMPENIGEQLTVKQFHDLFAFLMTLE
jgi:putative heme-binding domain-containing protein